jgi:hypothetical protein
MHYFDKTTINNYDCKILTYKYVNPRLKILKWVLPFTL